MIGTSVCQGLGLLAFVSILIHGNHFQGGTITYKLLSTSGSTASVMITQTYLYKWPTIYCDNAHILSQSTPNMTSYGEYNYTLNCVANCTTTGGYQPVPVRTYCTDYSVAMAISVTARTDIVNVTLGAYFTIAFNSSAWRTLSLPKSGSTSKDWSISCTIDLRLRSDTGKVNTPPVATMISPIYIRVGVQTSLVIPTIDGDNDQVRCRFASTATECADVCPPSSLPNGTVIIASNCTLIITGAKANDWYAVAVQIEDFASTNSTTPLSSVPVQFLINVYAKPTCTIAPVLYGQSNQTGTCQSLQVGQPHTMTLYAINYCTLFSVTIKDIATLSFPIVIKGNLTQLSPTLVSVTLTWTPTASQIGSQILCAVAFDSQSVQSNQYCTSFVVNQNNSTACPGEATKTTSTTTTTSSSTTTTTTTTVITSNTFTTESRTAIVHTSADHSASGHPQTTIDTSEVSLTTARNGMSISSTSAVPTQSELDTTQANIIMTSGDNQPTSSSVFGTDETRSTTGAEELTVVTTTPSYQSTLSNDDDTTPYDSTEAATIETTSSADTGTTSGTLSWLIPLALGLALLLGLLCCQFLCCPLPCGLGLFYKKQRDQVTPRSQFGDEQHPRVPRMFMISATIGKTLLDSTSSGSSSARSTNTVRSDIWLDMLPHTVRSD